ncbi:MAG: phosphonate ABC transporter ATP-binding protein [Thermoflexales bacterium]
MSLLEVRDLRLVYPNGHEALKRVSFKAEAGEIIALIGRSGAGKSTLLRCINGLERPTEGEVIVGGQVITRMNERQLREVRRRIGFIWQEHNLVERLPVLTNVLTGRLGYKSGLDGLFGYFNRSEREVAVRSLERVNLLHRAKQRADRLSGGEKQRASIARALTQQPRIILADEPVASLDPELAVQVMSDLARVAREDGALALISIHQVELAKSFVDRVIGLAQGVVVFDGPTERLDQGVMDRVYRFDKALA